MLFHWINIPHSVYPFIGCWAFWLFLSFWWNDAAISICVQLFVRTYIFISLGYISKSDIAGSNSNFMLQFFRYCPTVFQGGCIISNCYYQQCMRAPHQNIYLFYYNHPSVCEVISLWYLICIRLFFYLSYWWRLNFEGKKPKPTGMGKTGTGLHGW